MVRSVDELKRNVFPGESGGDYDALFGFSNRAGGAFEGVRPTQMTINQVLAFTDPSGPYAQWVKSQVGRVATPVGGFQVVGSTLRDTVNRMGLTGNELFDPAMQDRIGMEIYRAQGPGAWEGWGKGGGSVTMSTNGGQPMGLLDFAMQPEQPQTFRDRLRAPETRDAMLTWLNSMRLNPDPNIATLVDRRAQRREQASSANRTAAWLEANGQPDLAAAVMSGVIDGASAFKSMTAKDEKTALQQNVEFLMAQGYTMEDALKAVQGASGGTSVNIGEAMKIMPNGQIAVKDPSVDGGVRFVTPPGSQAAIDAEAAAAKAGQKGENEQIYGDAAINAIDKLVGPDGKGGLIDGGEGVFNLSNVGIVGKRLADWGLDQSAVDLRNTLNTVTSNIAFSRLQAMRDASVTGGALGSVTENELAMLMNSLGAVQQDTSAKVLRENLPVIRDIWRKIQSDPVARRAYAAAGAAGAAGASTAAPQGGDGDITTIGSW